MKNKKETLDTTARRFLGADLDNVHIVQNQKADPQRIATNQEKVLLTEACNFGDVLCRYVVAHLKLSFEQRVWGFSLALFCIRGDYPEGLEAFNVAADRGGDDLAFSDMNVITDEEQTAKIAKELPEFDAQSQQGAAKFAETTARYIETKKHQQGLSNPQAAYGIGRAFHNLRLGYPRDNGGTAAFDELVRRAYAYYDKYR